MAGSKRSPTLEHAMKLKALVYLGLITLVTSLGVGAHSQTFSVIHAFQGPEGSGPQVGVTVRAGVLYGTAGSGGKSCGMGTTCGTAYQVKHVGSNWIANAISLFPTSGSAQGYPPSDGVVFGPDGHLYGMTNHGFNSNGVVYRLTPPPSICTTAACLWTTSELHAFTQQGDGIYPLFGDLIWDQQGNLYGTTSGGGGGGRGTVFEMIGSGNNWTEAPIYSFRSGDGCDPASGVVMDSNGNLFGTTQDCGVSSRGTVYELTYDPPAGWQETTLYSFTGGSDGGSPLAGVALDSSRNLYGVTREVEQGQGSAVFELSPSGNTWTFQLLYEFPVGWGGSYGNLTLDAAGNLYGTTTSGGANLKGSVFKLTNTDNGWVYTSLHDFTGGSDGGFPSSNVTIDTDGTLYGTAEQGGSNNRGVVWMITP